MKETAKTLSLVATAIAAVMLMSPFDAFAQRDRQNGPREDNMPNETRKHRAERPRVKDIRPKIASQAVSSQAQSGPRSQPRKRFRWGRIPQNGSEGARVTRSHDQDNAGRVNRSDNRDRSRSVNRSEDRNRHRSVRSTQRRDRDLKRAQRKAPRRAAANRRALASRDRFPSAEHSLRAQQRSAGRGLPRGARRGFRSELGRINGMLSARGYQVPRRFRHPRWVADAARVYNPGGARYANRVDLGPIYHVIQRYGYGPHLVDNYVEHCSAQGISVADIMLGIQTILYIVEQFKGCLPPAACVLPKPVPSCFPAAACPLPPPPPLPACLPPLPACLPPLPVPPPLPGFCRFP